MSRRAASRLLGKLLLVGALMVLVLLPGMAAAQDYPPDTTVTTSGCENQYPPSQVCGTQVTVPQGGSSLPFTGATGASSRPRCATWR